MSNLALLKLTDLGINIFNLYAPFVERYREKDYLSYLIPKMQENKGNNILAGDLNYL